MLAIQCLGGRTAQILSGVNSPSEDDCLCSLIPFKVTREVITMLLVLRRNIGQLDFGHVQAARYSRIRRDPVKSLSTSRPCTSNRLRMECLPRYPMARAQARKIKAPEKGAFSFVSRNARRWQCEASAFASAYLDPPDLAPRGLSRRYTYLPVASGGRFRSWTFSLL